MKRLFITFSILLTWFAVLILTSPVMAGPKEYQKVANGRGKGGVVTDSCTSGLLFSWHFENTDVTLGGSAGGVNNGCSVGDTTATANGDAALNSTHTAQDGTNHGDFPTAYDRYTFTVTGDDIVKSAAGTIIIYFKFQTWAANNTIYSAYGDADDEIRITMSGTEEMSLTYAGQGGTTRTIVTTTADMVANTWYRITAKWSVAGVDESGTKYLSLTIDTDDTVYGTSAITAFTNALADQRFGDRIGGNSDFQLDNVKIYDSWL